MGIQYNAPLSASAVRTRTNGGSNPGQGGSAAPFLLYDGRMVTLDGNKSLHSGII
jgi:hypothetical protein